MVRAVRQPLYWAADPIKRLGARGDYLCTPAWLRGFEQVAEAGLVWDLLVYDEQLPDTHYLITSFPDTTFVLEATGWPLDLTAEGFSRWEERLRAVSEFPNVVLKLQGIALIFGTSLKRSVVGYGWRSASSALADVCSPLTTPSTICYGTAKRWCPPCRQPSVTSRRRNEPTSSVKPPVGCISCQPAVDVRRPTDAAVGPGSAPRKPRR